jgi:hypothetical protein
MAIDRISIIPYARKKEIDFFASNLRPDKDANFFFDETNVSPYVQNASSIIISGSDASKYEKGEGIVCESSNSFATIIKSISPNKLFINDNYLSLKLSQFDGSTTLTSSSFAVGDVIYQNENNSSEFTGNKFSARVEHWFSSNSTLIVTPLNGTSNVSSTQRVIHSVNATNRANLSSVSNSNKFPTSSLIKSSSDALKTSTVASYAHRHGIISDINPSTTKINLSSTYTGTTPAIIKVIDGNGFAQSSTITGTESDNTVVTISTSIAGLDGASKYSIGTHEVDDNGNLSGIFHLPENSVTRFRTGERIFTITDATTLTDKDATMKASARYAASGLSVEHAARVTTGGTRTTGSSESEGTGVTPVLPPIPVIIEPVVQPGTGTIDPLPEPVVDPVTEPPFFGDPEVNPPPPPPEPRTVDPNPFTSWIPNFNFNLGPIGLAFGDPVAQTFVTPKTKSGMFLSSVELYFKEKPDADDVQLPVTVKLVTTVNGYPTSRVIAQSTVQCSDVNVTDGVTTFPSPSNPSTITKFAFRDPVFLESMTEYALVVYSDSPTYEVWISELGQSMIGETTDRRVSEQPYVGSFFRSQNSSTWTPYQNQDLMFKINRAVFSTEPVTLEFSPVKQTQSVPFDEIILNASEVEFPSANIDHKMKTTLISTLTTESYFKRIEPNKPLWFAESTDSITTTGRRRIIPASNTSALRTQVIIDTNDDTVSPIFNSESYNILVSQNIINNGELYDSSITVTNGGFHDNVSNVTVTISDSDLYPGVSGARATANVTLNASGNVTSVNIINSGKGYVESPTITISEPGRAANATAVVTSEDSKYGGNAHCRYITRKVTLADGFDSGDLRVTVRAIRPQGTNIIVYYKVQSESDTRNFSDIKWRRMYLENDFNSPDLNTAIDFKYNPSADSRINKLSYIEDGTTYPLGGTFKHFAVKIVMLAECGCVAPTIRNLRAIALPEG